MLLARLGLLFAVVFAACDASASEIVVQPDRIDLTGWGDSAQLLIFAKEQGRSVDLTRDAECTLQSPAGELIRVDDRRTITALADGQGTLTVKIRDHTQAIPVTVRGVTEPPPVDFERDVQPILTRFSCNMGACHGKQRGQNGFQLSLLGFDSDFDFDALTKEGRGRRAFAAVPSASLLLTKPINALPHGGGKRFDTESASYRLLSRWLEAGAPRRQPSVPAIVGITVTPEEAVLAREAKQQVRVVASYADGSTRDVTALSAFQSNESAVAAVDDRGLITAGAILGDTAVMARFAGQIAVCTVLVPHPQPAAAETYAALPRWNPIDDLVWQRLQKLGIAPSPAASEQTVLRRLYLDLIGRGPTAEEARSYLADPSTDKRLRLIDTLLQHPEYAEHWASKWADLLRPNPYHVGIKATLNYDAWIRNAFRKNLPYDQFVRELLTAQGSTFRHGAVTLFRDRRTPDEITPLVSQLFLGIRLECAKCHHHPFEVYSQADFYSFAAYFAKLGRKGTGISAPISGSEEFIFAGNSGTVNHPLTGAALSPKPLFGTAPDVAAFDDPREALALWITSNDNPYFARTIANRLWAEVMGRGLVEPVDDLRGTNPPSNPALLDALAQHIRDQKYDLKQLLRLMTSSYVYGLSSLPQENNAADYRNFSRHYRQRIRAEVLHDTLIQITGMPETFEAMPPEGRAKELWTVRVDSLFLDAFGRQDPNQDPPCERNSEPTIVQALHLMNSNELFQKVTADKGLAATLAASERPPEQIIEELYLAVYARPPSTDESAAAVSDFTRAEANRRQATEDLLWALINTPEFVFED